MGTFNIGPCECCGGELTCDQLDACFELVSGGDPPGVDMSVTFSGVTNDGCTDCVDFNTAWVLSGSTSGTSELVCSYVWFEDFTGNSCGVTNGSVSINYDPATPANSYILFGFDFVPAGFAAYSLLGTDAHAAIQTLCGGGSVVIPYDSDGGDVCTWPATVTLQVV